MHFSDERVGGGDPLVSVTADVYRPGNFATAEARDMLRHAAGFAIRTDDDLLDIIELTHSAAFRIHATKRTAMASALTEILGALEVALTRDSSLLEKMRKMAVAELRTDAATHGGLRASLTDADITEPRDVAPIALGVAELAGRMAIGDFASYAAIVLQRVSRAADLPSAIETALHFVTLSDVDEVAIALLRAARWRTAKDARNAIDAARAMRELRAARRS